MQPGQRVLCRKFLQDFAGFDQRIFTVYPFGHIAPGQQNPHRLTIPDDRVTEFMHEPFAITAHVHPLRQRVKPCISRIEPEIPGLFRRQGVFWREGIHQRRLPDQILPRSA